MSASRGEQRREGGFSLGLAAGLALGFVISSVLVGTLGYLYVKRRDRDRMHNHGYPVIVALRDMPAGTLVTFNDIGQRSMPEHFVTGSVVKPDSAGYIVNQRLLVPVLAGDMLLWSQFEPLGDGGLPAEVR
jgi:pilus assembly protein CpaB